MIVRPTIRGEARQVHALGKTCNCHDLVRWARQGHVVGEGVEINDTLAEPLDWIVKINGQFLVVKQENFATCYEEMENEEEV